METRCEFSSINIPNDPKYTTIAARYVVEVADMIGFMDSELHLIDKGVRRAVGALIAYSSEADQRATMQIFCERIPEGLQVIVRDTGIPFDHSALNPSRTVSDSEIGQKINQLSDFMDEVRLKNLGTDGKEIVLIKHLKNRGVVDYYAACDLEPFADVSKEGRKTIRHPECTVRQMQDDEAADVSKSVYKAYGYSYPLEYIYFPEKIIALNQSGQIHSAVAVVGLNNIAGHCALQTWHENPQIAEMGQGVVIPEFRSRGCFAKLTAYLLDLAQSKGLLGVFDRAVTNHPYSQQTGHQSGARDCAVILGHVPLGATFKALTGRLSQRGSMVLQFHYLKKPPQWQIYPPSRHEAMIRKLYANLDIDPAEMLTDSQAPRPPDQASVFKINYAGATKVARIIIQRYGPDIVIEIQAELKELCLQKIEIVNIYLNLSNPLTASLTEQFEALGFFFAGILPACYPDGDAIILQYLNHVPIDYDKIIVASNTTEQLVDYIKNLDPNRI